MLEPQDVYDARRAADAAFAARQITRATRDVAHALAYYLALGTDTPSYAQLAERAGCAVRTVGRALPRLNDRGLVWWRRRGEERGGQWRRITSRYRLGRQMPAVITYRSRKGHPVRGSQEVRKKAAQERAPDAAEARRCLGEVAERRAPAILAAWQARRRLG